MTQLLFSCNYETTKYICQIVLEKRNYLFVHKYATKWNSTNTNSPSNWNLRESKNQVGKRKLKSSDSHLHVHMNVNFEEDNGQDNKSTTRSQSLCIRSILNAIHQSSIK